MKACYKIKRDGIGLYVKMYTTNAWPWYAASRRIKNRKEAKLAFQQFVEELREHVRGR